MLPPRLHVFPVTVRSLGSGGPMRFFTRVVQRLCVVRCSGRFGARRRLTSAVLLFHHGRVASSAINLLLNESRDLARQLLRLVRNDVGWRVPTTTTTTTFSTWPLVLLLLLNARQNTSSSDGVHSGATLRRGHEALKQAVGRERHRCLTSCA